MQISSKKNLWNFKIEKRKKNRLKSSITVAVAQLILFMKMWCFLDTATEHETESTQLLIYTTAGGLKQSP